MFEHALKVEAEYKHYISGKQIMFLILFVCIRKICAVYIYLAVILMSRNIEQISLIN